MPAKWNRVGDEYQLDIGAFVVILVPADAPRWSVTVESVTRVFKSTSLLSAKRKARGIAKRVLTDAVADLN